MVLLCPIHDILQKSYDPAYGARPVRRFIEKTIVTELSRMLVSGTLREHSDLHLHGNMDKGELTYQVPVHAVIADRSDMSMHVHECCVM